MSSPDSVRRFSDRVADYVRYRPGYPPELMRALADRAGLVRASRVADVGSGTGIFTALLLDVAGEVFAVEPNAEMRAAAEARLADRPGYHSLAGTSDATGLPAGSVSLITCAQAFHWFEPVATRREFRRILSPDGWCALIWNTHARDGSAFGAAYDRLRGDYGTDFRAICHENIPPERFTSFFGHAAWARLAFANGQRLDLPGLKGRLLSSSYAPKAGDPRHAPMMAALEEIFAACQRDGSVEMKYETELYLGRFA